MSKYNILEEHEFLFWKWSLNGQLKVWNSSLTNTVCLNNSNNTIAWQWYTKSLTMYMCPSLTSIKFTLIFSHANFFSGLYHTFLEQNILIKINFKECLITINFYVLKKTELSHLSSCYHYKRDSNNKNIACFDKEIIIQHKKVNFFGN